MAPKDYSKIDDVTRGAEMAMRAAGIKDQRKQTELMAKFKEQQMLMAEKEDERDEIHAKTKLLHLQAQTETEKARGAKYALDTKIATDEKNAKMMHQARLDNYAKDFDMPGTEHDYLNPLAQALIGQGELKKVADLVTGLTGKGPVVGSPGWLEAHRAKAKMEQEVKPPPDEFNRNLMLLDELEKAGKTDTLKYKLLKQRVEKQTAGDGWALSVDPSGNITVTQGGAPGGLASHLTAAELSKQTAQLDRFETVLGIIDTSIANISETPTLAGVWGSVRGAAQKMLGVASDVAPEQVAEIAGNAIKAIPGISKKQQEDLSIFFDTRIPENEIYENTIALELAKLRILAGGQGIRALESAFKAAKKDVKMTGLFSSQEVLARLTKIREEFQVEKDKLNKRLTGKGAAVPLVTTDDDYLNLPSGATFKDKYGNIREKP